MAPTVRPVILSGGAGTRLWPLSTPAHPKQFLDLVGGTLFQATMERVASLAGVTEPIVVTGRDHLSIVEMALSNSGHAAQLIVEPAGRNTAPAICAAALASSPDDVLLVLPADHVIRDQAGFATGVARAVAEAAQGAVALFGIVPTRPETGYGYIETGPAAGGGFEVARFKEKPDADDAVAMAGGGQHLWNSGMFAFTGRTILQELAAHRPDIVEAVGPSLPPRAGPRMELGDSFLSAPAVSIDHAVMEQTDKALVVPLDVGWSDVGSWQAVWEESPTDSEGNVLAGDVVIRDVHGSYVRATSRRVAVLGIDDIVVIETEDAVLVVPRAGSQLVREVAGELPNQ